MTSQLRVLLIHESPEDAALLVRVLAEGDIHAHWKCAGTPDQFSVALAEEDWDIIVSENKLSRFGALEALELLRSAERETPCIVISESFGEARVIELMRAGARDCIPRASLNTLVASVQRELPLAAARRARRSTEIKHQHLAALVEHSADAIIGVTLNGIIFSWNAAATGLYGWTAAEAIGKHIGLIVPGERADELPNIVARIRRGDRFPHADTERVRKDGSCVPVSLTVSPIHDGELVGISKTARDITERRRAEAVVARAALLLDHVQDAVVVTDLAGTVTYWSQGASRLFGWSSEETLGQPLWTRLRDGGRKKMEELILGIAGGNEFSGEWQDLRKDGTTLWLDCRISRIFDQSGRPIAILGTSHDITARKQVETERDRLLEQHRLQIDLMPLAYLLFDAELKLVDWNPAAEAIFGYRKDEVVGMMPPFKKLVAPGSLKPGGMTDRIRRGLQWASQMNENLTKDGRTISCEWHNARLTDADGGFAGVLSLGEDVSARINSEAAMLLRDRAIQAVTLGILITDPRLPDNPIIFASPGFETLTGYSQAEVLGKNCRFLQGPDADPATSLRLRDAVRAGQPCTVQILNHKKDNSPFWNELTISPVRDPQGELINFVGIQTDVTQRRLLEEQLRQAQKMDAVGRLAGGVAHDFNNLLTIIMGYTYMLLDGLAADDPQRELLGLIRDAGERSAALTRQLLIFSRQEVVVPKVLNVNDILSNLEKMLRRIIGEDIRFATTPSPTLHDIKVDAGQLEQVIMNLAINARDAMPQGGKLTIETSDVILDPADVLSRGQGHAGPHVVMSVTDNGSGMTPAVRARLFEPFFTTKGAGKGTGLGLAVVHGIVAQNEGHVEVTSAPGAGSCFKVFLPSLERSAKPAAAAAKPLVAPRGNETVLLVEDDAAVRGLASHILTNCGYTVLESGSGAGALDLARSHTGPIHLLITDVVMPDQGGKQVANTVCEARSEIKVLYVSGYTDDSVIRHGVLQSDIDFLEKPFSPLALATKVRGILDRVVP